MLLTSKIAYAGYTVVCLTKGMKGHQFRELTL